MDIIDRFKNGIRNINKDKKTNMEFTDFHQSDRNKKLILGLTAAVLIAIGIVYLYSQNEDSAWSGYERQTGYGWAGQRGSSYDNYTDYSNQDGVSPDGASSGRGCCNRGPGGGSIGSEDTGGGTAGGEVTTGTGTGQRGCCGGNTSAAGNVSLADLEKQALENYQAETGKSDVKAKSADFGCHIQIDITDAEGKVVRSYGYQGGPLYVIK